MLIDTLLIGLESSCIGASIHRVSCFSVYRFVSAKPAGSSPGPNRAQARNATLRQSPTGYICRALATEGHTVTAIFLPLGFLTGLLGINVGGIPGAQAPTAFWIFCGLLSLLVGLQLAMFRRLRWF